METLELLAELSIGLLGFSGVVSALGRSKLDISVREFRVIALLTYSATALIGSLVPVLLAGFQLESKTVWVASTLILLVLMPVGPVGTVLRYSSTLNNDPFLRIIGPPIMLILLVVWLSLCHSLVVGSAELSAVYAVGVAYLLGMGVFHFCMLVSSVKFEGNT